MSDPHASQRVRPVPGVEVASSHDGHASQVVRLMSGPVVVSSHDPHASQVVRFPTGGAVGYWTGKNASALSALTIRVDTGAIVIYGWLYEPAGGAPLVKWAGGTVVSHREFARDGVGTGYMVGSGTFHPTGPSSVKSVWAIVCDEIGGTP